MSAENQTVTWRGHRLNPGTWRGPKSVGVHIEIAYNSFHVTAWPNGKRYDATLEVNGGLGGRGFGKTLQGALDSALRDAINCRRCELAGLQALDGM